MKSDLDRIMAERGIDALLVSGPSINNPIMYYLTNGAGVGEVTVLVKKRGEAPILIVNPFEREEAAKSGLRCILRTQYDPQKLLNEEHGDQLTAGARFYEAIFADLGVNGNVAIYGREEQGRALALAEAINRRQSGVRLIGEFAENVFDVAWRTKDDEEIRRIRDVGERTVSVVGKTAGYLRSHLAADGLLVKHDGTPLTIGDVRRRIRQWLAEAELDDPEGFIFAIGRDAGVPHSKGEDTSNIELGKTIVFDIFPREANGGYHYDFTRTWCIGFAPPQVEKAYSEVIDVYNTVVAEARANDLCRVYQRRACNMFEAGGHQTICSNPRTTSGYVHALGHGIGLKVHESPVFRDYEANADILAPGCVITVEPGLYYPDDGGFGIRVEDTFWMNPASGRLKALAEYSKDLVLPLP